MRSPRLTVRYPRRLAPYLAVVAVAAVVAACGPGADRSGRQPPAGDPREGLLGEPVEEVASPLPSELAELRSFDPELGLDRPWFGDLDGMVERGALRALVTYSKTQYFLDGATQRGMAYEALREFESFLNRRLGRRTLAVKVVIIPVHRDELLPALEHGLGDLAVGNLTITDRRRERVDFSRPVATGVEELVVTGPAGPTLASLDDLAGREVTVRRSSSYWESLTELSQRLVAEGHEAVDIEPAEEFLEDEDLLEMVDAGLIETIVVDSHKLELWAEVFDRLEVHRDLAVRTGGQIGWAFRQDSPGLEEVVNAFIAKHRRGTLFGNILLQRYLEQNPWVRNNLEGPDRRRFEAVEGLFERYGERYDFDPLMLTALAYQESGLEQDRRSRAGAVGIMQIKPSTAADPNIGIADVSTLENNIHAGTKYLAFLRDRYFDDPEITPVNRTFLTFAAYNAGPARVRRLRQQAAAEGLDPDVWFNHVEVVAARRIGRETVRYVANIAKYWVAYRQLETTGGGE